MLFIINKHSYFLIIFTTFFLLFLLFYYIIIFILFNIIITKMIVDALAYDYKIIKVYLKGEIPIGKGEKLFISNEI